ncbi:MAG: DASH family cryptochrome, partial [Bacteroidota bacterium]
PVYIFDERVFKGKTKYGFPKTGAHRAKFIIESVKNLKASLKALNSDLLVRVGKPEEILFKLANQAKSSWIFCNRERTPQEVAVQDGLEQKLWTIGQELRYSRGKMLYYTADLPFPVTHTPDTFSQFRKEVERYIEIRKPLPRPAKSFNPLTVALDYGKIPSLQDFELEEIEKDERAVINHIGGESVALDRLNEYVWNTEAIKNHKDSRSNIQGVNSSSKFSAWLAQGCLSPKMIYHEIKKFEAQYGAKKSVYSLFYDLMMRDFYRLMAKKHGGIIFEEGGVQRNDANNGNEDMELFQRWMDGKTGVPFIDANMRELKHTGYISSTGRQNVASFLIKDLKLNWRLGADYFESILIDYDAASNYGNWNDLAGVGSDPKANRYVNVLAQAKRYDPEGSYVKNWIPELKSIPASKIHQPNQLTGSEQKDFRFNIGDDYPLAIVDLD